ncbi:hypothetical protein MXMO3_02743 [Maritalea myrionectae]|uniref:DUF4386 family protein n=1 Tax=Maritalea myrionectae TaxID=454601 RepID=A0A2R4MH99_9HYPH|nr:DUF4386 family protein [Maritalea myrionectae]AVX05254.1 hypothetical protein MXMO3_02743 [Maritalea myrionectae]
MMNVSLQKAGGWAGLVAGGTYIFGFGLLLAVFAPGGYFEGEAADKVQFMIDNKTLLAVWNFVIWITNSFAMVVLTVALYDRLKGGAPALAAVGSAYGLIWAGLILAAGMVSNISLAAVTGMAASDPEGAATLYLALSHVENGIGGGNELAGGFWVLVISLGAFLSNQLQKLLNILGMVIGAAGLSTLIAGASEIGGSIFGLGFIVWFIWAGVYLLRTKA